MSTKQSLGGRIAQARRELAVRLRKDITQLDLAKAVGASAATVSRWEADTAVPREEALLALARYFGVTPGFLRYGDGEQANAPTAAEALEHAEDMQTVLTSSPARKKGAR